MRTSAEINTIVHDIQMKLDARHRAGGPNLRVPPDGFMEEDDWLNVIVEPIAAGIGAYQYVQALGEVEQELRAEGMQHVLLVPALAD